MLAPFRVPSCELTSELSLVVTFRGQLPRCYLVLVHCPESSRRDHDLGSISPYSCSDFMGLIRVRPSGKIAATVGVVVQRSLVAYFGW